MRNVKWLDCVDTILNMSTRISTCGKKLKDEPREKGVAVVETGLKIRYDASNSCLVSMLHDWSAVFKVANNRVTPANTKGVVAQVLQDVLPVPTPVSVLPDVLPVPTPVGARNAVHTVRPTSCEYTCGVWQELLVPCCHAYAVLKKQHNKITWEEILEAHVHPYYTCGSLQQLYVKYIFPVCLDKSRARCCDKPSTTCGQTAGRPKTKRIRRRSEYADPRESKV